MHWREPAILSLVGETAATKFTSRWARPKEGYGSILLFGLILAAL
jgi:hypothetical protein